MLPIKTILHPTDFSKHSANAFEFACALARDYKARLVVMHAAVPPVVFMGEGMIPPEPADRTQLLNQLKQIKPQSGRIAVSHVLVDGDAAPEIVRTAREGHADVIVMGTHGRTGVGRLVMGSVAEQVMRHADCPVVTVKTPLVAQAADQPAEEVLVGANG